MKCKKCGKILPENAKFCLECGAAQLYKCKECGKILPENAKFCLECGAAQLYKSELNSNRQCLPVSGHKVDPSSVRICSGRGKFTEISTGEHLAYVKDNKTNLCGVINSGYEVIVPMIFYDFGCDSLERVSTDTIGQYPELEAHPTKECVGWGRIFINRSLDVRFDATRQEDFYRNYPTGKLWIEKHIHLLGREIIDRSGTWRLLEV